MIGSDHWSHSSAKLYLECPRHWHAQYVEGKRGPAGSALIKGKALDQVASENWRQKAKTHKDISITEAEEMGEQFYRDAVSEVGGRDEVDWSKETFPTAMESSLRMVRGHMVAHAPLYEPSDVQLRVTREIPGSKRYFLGFIDALDQDGTVIDVKSAGRKMPQGEADRDLQASAYAFALRRPIDFKFLRIIDNLKGVNAETISTTRSQAGVEWYGEMLAEADKGVEAGSFPARPGFWCGWCPIRKTCIESIV